MCCERWYDDRRRAFHPVEILAFKFPTVPSMDWAVYAPSLWLQVEVRCGDGGCSMSGCSRGGVLRLARGFEVTFCYFVWVAGLVFYAGVTGVCCVCVGGMSACMHCVFARPLCVCLLFVRALESEYGTTALVGVCAEHAIACVLHPSSRGWPAFRPTVAAWSLVWHAWSCLASWVTGSTLRLVPPVDFRVPARSCPFFAFPT